MSKLAKFKSALTVSEAATLLGHLISEEVSTEDIEMLYRSRRIGMTFNINSKVFKLTDEFTAPSVINQHRCFEEPKSATARCSAIYLPSDAAYIRSEDRVAIYRAIALRDSDGNFYVLSNDANPASFNFLSETDSFPPVEDGFVAPEELYKIAAEANIDKQAPPRTYPLNKNMWCAGQDDLFNFYPGEIQGVTFDETDARCTFEYVTSELEAMNLAAGHFWINYSNDRPPLQKAVSAFIAEKLGLPSSNRKTDALAAAIRPGDAPVER